jgi:hypothetical protein
MWHHFWTFASEAEIAALWGAGFLLIALVAGMAEMRGIRRARIERVGLVPWRGIFLTCAMIGTALLALAASGMASG